MSLEMGKVLEAMNSGARVVGLTGQRPGGIIRVDGPVLILVWKWAWWWAEGMDKKGVRVD